MQNRKGTGKKKKKLEAVDMSLSRVMVKVPLSVKKKNKTGKH